MAYASKYINKEYKRSRLYLICYIFRFSIPFPPPDLPEIQPNIPNPPPNLPEVASKLGTSETVTSTMQRKGVQINKPKYDQIPGMSHFFWKKINEQDITRETIWVGLNEHM